MTKASDLHDGEQFTTHGSSSICIKLRDADYIEDALGGVPFVRLEEGGYNYINWLPADFIVWTEGSLNDNIC